MICKKLFNQSRKKYRFIHSLPFGNEQERNPDINTKNWDLHKNRLNKFGRSQYKGLTFFVNEESRIYYLSEEGYKIYC